MKHRRTDPACVYYQPSALWNPGWRDWLLHPFRARRWWARNRAFDGARGVQCFACFPPTEFVRVYLHDWRA